ALLDDVEVARPDQRAVLVGAALPDARIDVPAVMTPRKAALPLVPLPRLLEPVLRLQRPRTENLAAADVDRRDPAERVADPEVQLEVVVRRPRDRAPRQQRRGDDVRAARGGGELCARDDGPRVDGLVAGVVEAGDRVRVLHLVLQAAVLETRAGSLENHRARGAVLAWRAVDLDLLRVGGGRPRQRRGPAVPVRPHI